MSTLLHLPRRLFYFLASSLCQNDIKNLSKTCKTLNSHLKNEEFYKYKLSTLNKITFSNHLSRYHSWEKVYRHLHQCLLRFDKNIQVLPPFKRKHYNIPLIGMTKISCGPEYRVAGIKDNGKFGEPFFIVDEDYVYFDIKEEAIDISCAGDYLAILGKSRKLYFSPLSINDKTVDLTVLSKNVDKFAITMREPYTIAFISNQKLYTITESKRHFVAKNVINVVAGENHLLYLDKKGCVYGIGNNNHNQLALDRILESEKWRLVAYSAKKIFAGPVSSAYINLKNELYVCGYNKENMFKLKPNRPIIRNWTKIAENIKDLSLGYNLLAYKNIQNKWSFIDRDIDAELYDITIMDKTHLVAIGYQNQYLNSIVCIYSMLGLEIHHTQVLPLPDTDIETVLGLIDKKEYPLLFKQYNKYLHEILMYINGPQKINIQIWKLAIQYGLDPSNPDISFSTKTLNMIRTPLTYAAYFSDVESIKYLLSVGANVHIRDAGGYNVLEMILVQEKLVEKKEIVALLVDKNIQIRRWIYNLAKDSSDIFSKCLSPVSIEDRFK